MKLILVLSLLNWISGAEFDYIVVGSGTGGGTVATELALKKFKVLLIEAGPDYFGVNQTVPVFHGRASEDPIISYDFKVKHYNNGRKYFYPRASVLGGCSTHNAEITVYPNSGDFEYMQSITNDPSWSESNIRKHFTRMERNQYPASLVFKTLKDTITNGLLNLFAPIKNLVSTALPSLVGHGYDGWFTTSIIDVLRLLKLDFELFDVFLAEIGNIFIDINGYNLLNGGLNTDYESTFFVPQSVDAKNLTRVNFPGYIKQVASQGYLTILTDAFVTKVLIDGNNKAYGVEYRKGNYLYRANPLGNEKDRKIAPNKQILVNKEVILSGGTFNTPQILMLSGIGDSNQLTSFGIPIKKHLPSVGRNMMDRYEISVVNKYRNKLNLLKDCKFMPSMSDPCYVEYINSRGGPYTTNGIIAGELKKYDKQSNYPDVFILSTITDFHGYYHGYSNVIGNSSDSFTRLIVKARQDNANGYVRLLSNDPLDVPDINFQSFSDSGGEKDLEIMIQAIKDQREFIKKNILLSHSEIKPGHHIQSDQELRDFILDQAWGHHACCTARMGKDQDPNSVLDSKFRVRGIQNLRVVDASALPRLPGYFPTLFIHLMAMKAADDISLS